MDSLSHLPLKPWHPSRLIWLLSGILFILAGLQEFPPEKESLASSLATDSLSQTDRSLISEVAFPEAVSSPPESPSSEELGLSSESVIEPCEIGEPDVDLDIDSSGGGEPSEEDIPDLAGEEGSTGEEPIPEAPILAPPIERLYEIRPGDSLWLVSQQYNIDTEVLAAVNGLSDSRYLRPGQTLVIPPGKGVYHSVERGESLWEICRSYHVEMQDVVDSNQIEDPTQLQAGSRLFLPGAYPCSKEGFLWPLRGRITSGFGYRIHPIWRTRKFHHGIDISSPRGRLIRAARDGGVIVAGRQGDYGLAVFIKHNREYTTVYGHASEILVRVGQKVRQGDPIARVGSTGVSTGPHLHFEIRKSGRAINPRPLLP